MLGFLMLSDQIDYWLLPVQMIYQQSDWYTMVTNSRQVL